MIVAITYFIINFHHSCRYIIRGIYKGEKVIFSVIFTSISIGVVNTPSSMTEIVLEN